MKARHHFEQFLEKIKDDLADVMVGLVNRQLETKLINLAKENESLKKIILKLGEKGEENKSLKRKLSQMQIELDQVQQKRRRKDFSKDGSASLRDRFQK